MDVLYTFFMNVNSDFNLFSVCFFFCFFVFMTRGEYKIIKTYLNNH